MASEKTQGKTYVGIDLGGTKLFGALVGADGALVEETYVEHGGARLTGASTCSRPCRTTSASSARPTCAPSSWPRTWWPGPGRAASSRKGSAWGRRA